MQQEWILYDSYSDYFKANVMLHKLHSYGLDTMLKDENTVTMDPMLGNAIGGIKLMVLKVDTDKIIELNKQWAEEAKANIVCPKCNSSAIVTITEPKPQNWLFAIFTTILTSFAVAATCSKCENCGHQFK